MRVLVASLLLCSFGALAGSINVNAQFNVTGQYQKSGEKEFTNKTSYVTGFARVSGRVDGQSIDQKVDIPLTTNDSDSVMTVNDDNTIRVQNLKEGTDNTYKAKVKRNRDGSVKEIKVKGRAMEKALMGLLSKELDKLKADLPEARIDIGIDDFVCKADDDLVGVLNCGSKVKMTVSANLN